MAEVVNVPKLGPSQGGLTREQSSLDGTPTKKREPIQRVDLKGTVVQKRPSFLSKLKETFIAEDARDVGDYIVWDILIPTVKRTIRDIIVGSTDRIFLGTNTSTQSSNLYRDRGVTYVRKTDYSGASKVKTPKATPQQRTRSAFHLNDMIFEKYDDAASVLERMIDYLDTYGKVSVDDYLDLVGQSSDYTAQNWGWTSLTSATIVNTVGGYLIKLPNPVIIKE